MPIQDYSLKQKIRTGIDIVGEFEWNIPEYHVMCAAKAYGYPYFTSWQELSPKQKAKIVAHYFIEGLISAHQQEAASNKKG